MKYPSIYSKQTLKLFKIFILSAISILIVSTTRTFLQIDFSRIASYYLEILSIIINTVSIALFSILVFFPHKFEFCAITAFIYSIFIFIYEPKNTMSVILFYLAVSFLYARSFYNEKRKLKNIITVFILFTLTLTELRFGFRVFIESLIEKLGFSFVYFVSVYFLCNNLINSCDESQDELILNVGKYKNLTLRDAQWLVEIIKGSKYEKIAIESQMNLGSVKNRLKIIFEELNVGDKRGFMNKYSIYKIVYNDQNIE